MPGLRFHALQTHRVFLPRPPNTSVFLPRPLTPRFPPSPSHTFALPVLAWPRPFLARPAPRSALAWPMPRPRTPLFQASQLLHFDILNVETGKEKLTTIKIKNIRREELIQWSPPVRLDFPEEIPENFWKDPGNVRLGCPQTL